MAYIWCQILQIIFKLYIYIYILKKTAKNLCSGIARNRTSGFIFVFLVVRTSFISVYVSLNMGVKCSSYSQLRFIPVAF